MVKKFLILITLLLTLVSCGKSNGKEEIVYRKGIVYEVNGSSPFTGVGASYYDKNNIESEGQSKDGIKQGKWKYYFYNGKIKKEGSYIGGKEDGKWIYYNHDGSIRGEAFYKEGEEIKK